MTTMTLPLTDREHATVLAALRFWQRMPSELSEPENDIATNGDEHAALTLEEIDALCERINTQPDGVPR
jgi:hypothetical protein